MEGKRHRKCCDAAHTECESYHAARQMVKLSKDTHKHKHTHHSKPSTFTWVNAIIEKKAAIKKGKARNKSLTHGTDIRDGEREPPSSLHLPKTRHHSPLNLGCSVSVASSASAMFPSPSLPKAHSPTAYSSPSAWPRGHPQHCTQGMLLALTKASPAQGG